MIKDMFKELPKAIKSGPATRWYVKILPGDDWGEDEPVIESRWFDTRDEAIEWNESITYRDHHVVGRSVLCCVEGSYTTHGRWTWDDDCVEEEDL